MYYTTAVEWNSNQLVVTSTSIGEVTKEGPGVHVST